MQNECNPSTRRPLLQSVCLSVCHMAARKCSLSTRRPLLQRRPRILLPSLHLPAFRQAVAFSSPSRSILRHGQATVVLMPSEVAVRERPGISLAPKRSRQSSSGINSSPLSMATSHAQRKAINSKLFASSSVSMSPRCRAIQVQRFRHESTEGGTSGRMSPQ